MWEEAGGAHLWPADLLPGRVQPREPRAAGGWPGPVAVSPGPR